MNAGTVIRASAGLSLVVLLCAGCGHAAKQSAPAASSMHLTRSTTPTGTPAPNKQVTSAHPRRVRGGVTAAASTVAGATDGSVDTAGGEQPSAPPASAGTPTTPPVTRPSTATTNATLDVMTRSLASQAGGQHLTVVRAATQWQAASDDDDGRIAFWTRDFTAGSWTLQRRTTYVYFDMGSAGAHVVGRVLPSNPDTAVFILTGTLTGDGSGTAIAFTRGPAGWGTVKALPGGNLQATTSPVGKDMVGVETEAAFVGAYYQTKECNPAYALAECHGPHAIVKQWAWEGDEIARV